VEKGGELRQCALESIQKKKIIQCGNGTKRRKKLQGSLRQRGENSSHLKRQSKMTSVQVTSKPTGQSEILCIEHGIIAKKGIKSLRKKDLKKIKLKGKGDGPLDWRQTTSRSKKFRISTGKSEFRRMLIKKIEGGY